MKNYCPMIVLLIWGIYSSTLNRTSSVHMKAIWEHVIRTVHEMNCANDGCFIELLLLTPTGSITLIHIFELIFLFTYVTTEELHVDFSQ